MIKSLEHAKEVQKRRVESGKRGYAKAVRRFLQHNNGEYYSRYKAQLPVNWENNHG